MVVIGDFCLEIVDANTNKKLKEHVHKNNSEVTYYVEIGEPQQQYFIRLIKHRNNPNRTVAKVSVDGKPLGYNWQQVQSNDLPGYLGPCIDSQSPSEIGGDKRIRCFQFVNKISDLGEQPDSKVGIIEATWYNVTNVRRTKNYSYPIWSEAPARGSNNKKNYQSQVGPIGTNLPTSKETWTCGTEIAKITVLYRSALGLLKSGVIGSKKAKQNKKDDSSDDSESPSKKPRLEAKRESHKNTTIDLT